MRQREPSTDDYDDRVMTLLHVNVLEARGLSRDSTGRSAIRTSRCAPRRGPGADAW